MPSVSKKLCDSVECKMRSIETNEPSADTRARTLAKGQERVAWPIAEESLGFELEWVIPIAC